MKQKIGFISIGQAGGNIGRLFEQNGYSVIYLNTSKEDLNTLSNVKYKYHIQGGEGCNKNRKKAKQLVIADFDNISKHIYEKLNVELVYVIFSSGGGTGSGAGPMLIDLLLNDIENDKSCIKYVAAITVIPGLQESIKANMNSYECFSEILGISKLSSTFILDNDKGQKLSINKQFTTMFCDFLNVPTKHISELGNIDKAEVMETLSAHGMSTVSVLSDKNSNTAGLLNTFAKNIFAPLEDDRVVKYIAISQAAEIELNDLKTAIGLTLDDFVTYNKQQTICVLYGLSFPRKRLDSIYKKINDNKQDIMKNLVSVTENTLKDDVNFLDSILDPSKMKEKAKSETVSRSSILSKYL